MRISDWSSDVCSSDLGNDQLRFDEFDLPIEIRATGFGLIALGITIARRPAFDDVGDEHGTACIRLLSRTADALQHLIEQLARTSNKRLATRIFVRTRSFTDDHQRSVLRPDAEHGLRARTGDRKSTRLNSRH